LRGPPCLCHHARAVPTYDYQCRACGTVTEVIHSMLEDGPSVCELCGGDLRRVLFPSGIIFKGSGFYRNDSRAARSDAGGDSEAGAGSKKPATAESGKTSGESGKTSGESGRTSGSEAGSGSSTGDGASSSRKAPSSEAGSS
jgi:putative FmdB family regulatory protein